MSAQVKEGKEPARNDAAQLPDPKEMAQTYAEVAQRASKLIADHIQRQMEEGHRGAGRRTGHRPGLHGHDGEDAGQSLQDGAGADEPGVGLLLAVAAFDDALHRHDDGAGGGAGQGRQPLQGRASGKQHFLFDFIKQSYLITARHVHDAVSNVEGLDDNSQQEGELLHPPVHRRPVAVQLRPDQSRGASARR